MLEFSENPGSVFQDGARWRQTDRLKPSICENLALEANFPEIDDCQRSVCQTSRAFVTKTLGNALRHSLKSGHVSELRPDAIIFF